MLNQEQAEAALKKFESKEFVKRRQTLCGKLPARLRETSRGLCGCNVRGKEISDWIERHKVMSQAAAELDAMTVDPVRNFLTPDITTAQSAAGFTKPGR